MNILMNVIQNMVLIIVVGVCILITKNHIPTVNRTNILKSPKDTIRYIKYKNTGSSNRTNRLVNCYI